MSDLTSLSLIEAAHALRDGETSSRDLTLACLERISSLDDQVHAFLAVTDELALEGADYADKHLASWRRNPDEALPLTWGIPIAIKDVLTIKDVPTTCGSKILENFRPPYTSTSVQRLIDTGAVILWKTNTD